jgi:hypothetical protein
MSESEFTTVPVLANLNGYEVIGELRILTSALPPTPNFVFSLGFQALEVIGAPEGELHTKAYVGKYKLLAVAPVYDDNYISYLRHIGRA